MNVPRSGFHQVRHALRLITLSLFMSGLMVVLVALQITLPFFQKKQATTFRQAEISKDGKLHYPEPPPPKKIVEPILERGQQGASVLANVLFFVGILLCGQTPSQVDGRAAIGICTVFVILSFLLALLLNFVPSFTKNVVPPSLAIGLLVLLQVVVLLSFVGYLSRLAIYLGENNLPQHFMIFLIAVFLSPLPIGILAFATMKKWLGLALGVALVSLVPVILIAWLIHLIRNLNQKLAQHET